MSKKMRSIVRQRRREVEQKRRKRGESIKHVADDNSAIENALMDVAHMMKVGGVGVTSWKDGDDEVFLLVRASQHQPDATVEELIQVSEKSSQEDQHEGARHGEDISGENQVSDGEGVAAQPGGG